MVFSRSTSNRNSNNNRKATTSSPTSASAFSRPSVKVAAGLACLSLIGLQLTSDVDTYGSVRRRMEVKEEVVITDGDDGDGDKVDVENTSASTTITPSLFDRTNEDKRAFQQELDRRFDDKRRLVENTTLDGSEPKCTFWGGETGILGPTQIPTDIDFTNTVVSLPSSYTSLSLIPFQTAHYHCPFIFHNFNNILLYRLPATPVPINVWSSVKLRPLPPFLVAIHGI